MLGTKFRIVSGYPGQAQIALAMEREEIQGSGNWSFSDIEKGHPDWIAQKKIRMLLQLGLTRSPSPALHDVPLVMDIARTSAQRQVFAILMGMKALGRPYFVAPGVPADRTDALRSAFMATMNDPDFLEEAKRAFRSDRSDFRPRHGTHHREPLCAAARGHRHGARRRENSRPELMAQLGKLSRCDTENRMARSWLYVSLLVLLLDQAKAEPVADFYRGRTVTLYIGYSVGGGYDNYARVLARHLGNHIPGNPSILPQNMPGAGSLRALNYLYNAAPRDGTAIATFGRGLAMEPLIGSSPTQFDARKLVWLGSGSDEISLCGTWHTSRIKTWKDMQSNSFHGRR